MILLLSALACEPDTGGRRVVFDAEVVPTAPVSAGELQWIDESTGWRWTLTEATAWVGPVYMWSDEPLLDVDGWSSLHPLVGPNARADADHFVAGVLRGEVTRQVAVDLLAGPVSLGVGRGTAGPSRSAEVWLEPPVQRGATTLAFVGEATKEDRSVPFRVGLSFEDGWVNVDAGENPVVLRRLRGLLWEAELDDGGLLSVGVDLRPMFRGADPSELVVGPSGVAEVHRADGVGRMLYHRSRAVGDSGPWSLRWTP